MSSQITPDDVAKMMVSVSEMEFDLYPKSYKTDADIVNMLRLSAGSRLMYRSEVFAFIDLHYGNITKWFAQFRRRFGESVSIEEHYDELVENFSSPEIISYYNIYPNLSYLSFNVSNEKDTRACRNMNKTVMSIPDARIKSMFVNLRGLYGQDVVDRLNKFMIKKGYMTDNAMFKKPTVASFGVSDVFDILSDFVSEVKDENLANMLYSEISFLDIEELSNVRVTLLTDYPKI